MECQILILLVCLGRAWITYHNAVTAGSPVYS